MTDEIQIQAFQNELNALCIRYLQEFDISPEHMIMGLCSQQLIMMDEFLRMVSGEETDEGWKTSPA